MPAILGLIAEFAAAASAVATAWLLVSKAVTYWRQMWQSGGGGKTPSPKL